MSVSLFFDIFGRDKGVGKLLDDVGDKADANSSRVSNLGKGMAVASAGFAAIGAGALAVFKTGFDELQDASAMTAQLEAGLKSTGGVAGTTVESMNKLAAEIQNYSGQTDDSIANTQSLLLTFTNIRNVGPDKIFDDTTRAAADMAAKLGGDAASQAMLLGKALNDPAEGMGKLQRAGVSFTDAQVATIKSLQETGDLAGAQKLILGELEVQFGGAAKAAGDSLPGQLAKGQRSFEDMSQKLTEALLPAILSLTAFLTDAAKWVTENSDLVMTLAGVLGVLAAGIGVATAAQWLFNMAAAANPVGAVILAITGLIAVIVLLAANWDNIVRFLTDVWNNFTKWWGDGMNKIGGQWNDFWSGMGKWATDTWNGFVGFFKDGWNGFTGWWGEGMGKIGTQWNGLWDGLRAAAKAPISFVINTVINDGLIGAFNTVAGWIPGVQKLGRVSIPGFADGGYTGEGGKHDPKGIVHGGEYVFTKEETQKAGVSTLQRLSRVLRGFAEGGFVNPVDGGGTVTQGFSGLNGHNGIDIAGPLNTRIMAAFDGNVTSAGWSPHGGGNEVHIKHPGGWETWYAHLNKLLVRVGQTVNRAATIGLMGSTGNSTGSHLHYMVMNGGWPNVVDPSPYMAGKSPAGSFNPIAAILDGLIGSVRGAFAGGGMLADIGIGVIQKLAGDMGGAIMGGTGSTRGGLGLDVFDSGGWLDTVGVNKSGKPEAVLTGPQWDTLRANANRPLVVYVQNPFTGEYLRAEMVEIADDAIGAANDDLSRGRAR